MAKDIEDVDIIGNAIDFGEAVAAVDSSEYEYVISSHNFEHLPDPIRFLQGVSKVLKNGGHLSMAIPDKRCCFDYFRPVSTIGGFIEAYVEKRRAPSNTQIFEQKALGSSFIADGKSHYGFVADRDPSRVHPGERLETAYADWMHAISASDSGYTDAHCWTFTPSSLELILRDLKQLGLIKLTVVEIVMSPENEMFVHLVNDREATKEPDFYTRRKSILRRMMAELTSHVLPEWAFEGVARDDRPAESRYHVAIQDSPNQWGVYVEGGKSPLQINGVTQTGMAKDEAQRIVETLNAMADDLSKAKNRAEYGRRQRGWL